MNHRDQGSRNFPPRRARRHRRPVVLPRARRRWRFACCRAARGRTGGRTVVAVGADHARRHHHHPHRRRRDGAGLDDLAAARSSPRKWTPTGPKVQLELAPADAGSLRLPNAATANMSIVGSRAVQLYYTQLRIAGAQVRKVLIANAAEKWGVDAATLKTEPSVVDRSGLRAASELRRDRRASARCRRRCPRSIKRSSSRKATSG